MSNKNSQPTALEQKGFHLKEDGFWWRPKRDGGGDAHFCVYLPGTRGKQTKKRKSGQYKKFIDAQNAFHEFRRTLKVAELVLQPPPQPAEQAEMASPVTFRNYFAEHGEWSVWAGCGPSTQKVNMSLVKNMLGPFFGDMLLTAITASTLKDYIGWCKKPLDEDGNAKTVYGNYTINNSLRRFREIMGNAQERETIARLPPFELLPEDDLRLEFTPEERNAFLAAFGHRNEYMRWYSTTRWNDTQSGFIELEPWHEGVKFGDKRYGRNPNTKDAQRQFELFQSSEVWFVGALDTGLRKSDLTNLPRRGVKFKDRIVTTVMNKTGVEVTIPLGSVLAEHLKQSMGRAKGTISTETPVILTPRGKRYDESTLKRYFKIAKWIAGITRRFRLHDLRHSFASDMGSEGYGEHVLMGLLGHTTTAMTRRYVRPHASLLESIRRHIDARHLSPESTELSER